MASITSYTKARLDDLLAALVPGTRTVNSKALSSDITLNKSDIGLSNVDNTSDANKPVSDDTAAAIAAIMPVYVLAAADPDPTSSDPAGLYFRRSS